MGCKHGGKFLEQAAPMCVRLHQVSHTALCTCSNGCDPDVCPRSKDRASHMGYPFEKGYQNVSVQPIEQTAVFSVGLCTCWVSGITRQESWEGLRKSEALLMRQEG